MTDGDKPKTLKETLESHPVILLLGVACAAFAAGFGAHGKLQETAGLQVISPSELAELKGKASAVCPCPPSSAAPSQGTTAPLSSVVLQGPDRTTVFPFEFSAKPPFPIGYESVTPGMRLSDAQRAYPGGEIDGFGYRLQPKGGPFMFVSFLVDSQENDPVVYGISFAFRNEPTGNSAIVTTERALATKSHHDETLGTRVSWPDVSGFEISVDKSYLLVQLTRATRKKR